MGILEGKNILVAGVTLDTSIGFHVARIAQAEGATVVVSNFGRAMSLTGGRELEIARVVLEDQGIRQGDDIPEASHVPHR